jgi:hypothetical protein
VVGIIVHNGVVSNIGAELHGGYAGRAHATRDREVRRTEAQRGGASGIAHTPHWERQAPIVAEARCGSSVDSSPTAAVTTITTICAVCTPFYILMDYFALKMISRDRELINSIVDVRKKMRRNVW